MATPEPLDDDDHGEELLGGGPALTPAQQAQLAALDDDMVGTPAAELAARFDHVVPDGGEIGRALTPTVKRAARLRDWTRVWGPAVAGTAVAGTTVLVLPVPGPLALYVLAVAAFGWWHCAGRPGVTESVQMIRYAVADAGTWIRDHVERISHRRAAAESRRTLPTTRPQTETN